MLHLGCCFGNLTTLGWHFSKGIFFNTSKVNDYILDGSMTGISNGHICFVDKYIKALKMWGESCIAGFMH